MEPHMIFNWKQLEIVCAFTHPHILLATFSKHNVNLVYDAVVFKFRQTCII